MYLAFQFHTSVGVIGIVSTIVTLSALSLAAFSDPGMVVKRDILGDSLPDDVDQLHVNHTYCTQCHVFRQRGTFHCRTCGICMEGLDHHCPWTGKKY